MGIVLGPNRYGKAEVRLVRVDRDSPVHAVTDLSVSTTLAGDLAATHLTGDNAGVLPTDSQKNAVYAFARDGVGEIEDFALRLARWFVDSQPSVHRARVAVEQYGWTRIEVAGAPAPHSFVRQAGARTAAVTYDGASAHVVSGVGDLTVLNSTGSAFRGYPKDRYTTLPETDDRILATAVDARWRHRATDPEQVAGTDWADSHAGATRRLLEAFASTESDSLQQTLYAMGGRVLDGGPELAEVRLSLPNKHHFLVDLAPFGLDNPGEVFFAADRPYGLIEGTVLRDDVDEAPEAW